MIKDYYRLTKPGIIYGNLLTAIGGFMLASRGHVDPMLLVATILGTGLVIASACVFNNIQDQDIDAKMRRTSKRAIVVGDISEEAAWTYGAALGLLGGFILLKMTNNPTFLIGLLGWVSYVLLYTPAKKRTVHATLIGSIPGATSIAAGYTAANGMPDIGAVLLFAIMFLWQMPHFYAISMFRRDEYAAAGIPVLAVVSGMKAAKQHIVLYMFLFAVAAAALALYGYASFTYFVIMLCVSAWWLWKAARGFRKVTDDVRWSRSIFGGSLLVLLIMSITLSLDAWLP
jgi:heme o synthase